MAVYVGAGVDQGALLVLTEGTRVDGRGGGGQGNECGAEKAHDGGGARELKRP